MKYLILKTTIKHFRFAIRVPPHNACLATSTFGQGSAGEKQNPVLSPLIVDNLRENPNQTRFIV
jgi:hypothetical protein